MATQILKVTPAEVQEKAQQISNQKQQMEGFMQEMVQKVSQLGDAWKAPSGETYTEKFQNVRQEIQDSLNTLQKHTDNLVQAAQAYEELETTQQQKVDSLSTENIF